MSSVQDRVQNNNNVLQSVRRAALHFGITSEGAMGQQILLLGDAFYGYRFTARDYTAVWSATDQTLKIFDLNGCCLGNSLLSVPISDMVEGQGTLRYSEDYQQRRAA